MGTGCCSSKKGRRSEEEDFDINELQGSDLNMGGGLSSGVM